jgi:hypothetical protein
VKADIFGLDGRFVGNIYSGFLDQGIHVFSWAPRSMEEGIFICKLRYDDKEYCTKIIRN